MGETNINEIMDVIEFKDKPLERSEIIEENGEDEKIRIYVPPRVGNKKPFLLRFIILTAVFFLLFLCIAKLITDRQTDPGEDTGEHFQAVVTTDSIECEESTTQLATAAYLPVVIDESKMGIELNIKNDYSLYTIIQASEGVKVFIIHSHNSEYVSESLTVCDAGDAIKQLLTSAGIKTYHCVTEHDSEGNIGAYFRMKESLASLIQKYPEAVCVIDIHDSDSGIPITFTVGTDSIGWSENLRLAEAVCGKMTGTETAFRFLPGSLGQDSGLLTLNIGFCGENTSDEDARTALASFAEAFIAICNEKASAP